MRIKEKHIFLYLFICVPLLACGGAVKSDMVDVSAQIHQDLPQQGNGPNASRSKSNLFKWSEVKLPSEENLSVIYLLNSKEGWIGSRKALYKTVDEGATWERINLEMPSGSRLSAISFASQSLGWITGTKYATDVLRVEENEGYIIHTDDGGKSWRIQYKSGSSQINRVRFINQREGWAVGRRLVDRGTLQSDELLILRSTDQGTSWTDLSGKVNDLVSDRKGRVQDYATDIYATDPLKATLLTVEGKIIRTTDGGQSWQKVETITDEPQQTFISRIGYTPNNRLWMLGGADSREGMWGMLAQQESGSSWTRYRMDARLSDVVYLSATQLLACGSIRPHGDEDFSDEDREGVILYSDDNGRNWTIVYCNKESASINSLSISDSNHIWAVGEGGLVLKLQASSE